MRPSSPMPCLSMYPCLCLIRCPHHQIKVLPQRIAAVLDRLCGRQHPIYLDRPDRLPRRHRRNITDGAAILRRTHQHDRGTLRHLCRLCRPVMPVIADPQLRNKRCPRAGALLARDHCNFPTAAHSRIPTTALLCGSTPAKAKHHHAARRQQQPKLPTPTLSPAQLCCKRGCACTGGRRLLCGKSRRNQSGSCSRSCRVVCVLRQYESRSRL